MVNVVWSGSIPFTNSHNSTSKKKQQAYLDWIRQMSHGKDLMYFDFIHIDYDNTRMGIPDTRNHKR